MFLDSLLDLGIIDNTLPAASPSIIDTVAVGESCRGAWLYVHVLTAFAASVGAPYGQFELQTSESEDFNEYTTLVASGTYNAAALAAGKEIKLPIGNDVKQYLRGYFWARSGDGTRLLTEDSVNAFSSSPVHMYIVKDVGIENVYA